MQEHVRTYAKDDISLRVTKMDYEESVVCCPKYNIKYTPHIYINNELKVDVAITYSSPIYLKHMEIYISYFSD